MNGPSQTPVESSAGLNPARERIWGLVGGIIGAVVGVGSALIAVYAEGMSWRSSSSPYPEFFKRSSILAYDKFLLGMLIVGALFLIGAMIAARTGRFPRTDAFGATLVGTILMIMSGALLFTRLVAIASVSG
jgi:hypothetical protein